MNNLVHVKETKSGLEKYGFDENKSIDKLIGVY